VGIDNSNATRHSPTVVNCTVAGTGVSLVMWNVCNYADYYYSIISNIHQLGFTISLIGIYTYIVLFNYNLAG
jgi:hypothetical protein